MRKKIPKFVVVVGTAVVTVLLMCSYYHTRMPQDYRKVKYRAFFGVKGQLNEDTQLDSLSEDQHDDPAGSIPKQINRIYVTSATNKQIHRSDVSGFISKVHVPTKMSAFLGVISVLQQNEWREAHRNISDMNSYVHETQYHGSDDLKPNDRNNNVSPVTTSPSVDSRSHDSAPASIEGSHMHNNSTGHKTLEWIHEESWKEIPPNSSCSDSLCSEYLTPQDWSNFKTCASRAQARYRQLLNSSDTDITLPLGKCHFMDGRNRPAIALVSFPGSGNTWVRGLLEQGTGVCTGKWLSGCQCLIINVCSVFVCSVCVCV